MKHTNSPFHSAPKCPGGLLSRRNFLKYAATASALFPAVPAIAQAKPPEAEKSVPRAPVSIRLCKRYDFAEARRALAAMLDELGDVRKLVKNKYVAVKTNLVNTSEEDVGGVPVCLTVTSHPVIALALGSLLVDYGAKKVTFCDQLPFRTPDPEAFAGYGYHLDEFNQIMNGKADFQNTRNLGRYKNYALVKVPGGGEIANAWEVNQLYAEAEVLVSLGKLKSHVSGGITGGMKNLFGIPPSSMYGNDLDDEPSEMAVDYRSDFMHTCQRKPLTSVETFTGKTVLNDHGFNVPRMIVDLNAAFPVDLTVIDGVSVIQTAEGWWNGSMVSITRPGLLLAGRNTVCVDAVAAAVMGFDPDAPDYAHPFVNGTNYLAMSRRKGMGENRIREIELVGVNLEKARFEYQPTYQRVKA